MTSLLVSEFFGPTFQGEGPSAGRRAAFLRLGLCNLNCSWCDTPFTWDWTGEIGPKQDKTLLQRFDPVDLVNSLRGFDVPLVVVTGGEPMLQQKGLAPVVEGLHLCGHDIEVETNGTRPITEQSLRSLVTWNVSPKLSGSGVDYDRAIVPDVLSEFVDLKARLKFVVTGLAELDEVEAICELVEVPADLVWIMPEGRTATEIQQGLRRIAGPVLDRGWNLGGRLHVTLWDDERGR